MDIDPQISVLGSLPYNPEQQKHPTHSKPFPTPLHVAYKLDPEMPAAIL